MNLTTIANGIVGPFTRAAERIGSGNLARLGVIAGVAGYAGAVALGDTAGGVPGLFTALAGTLACNLAVMGAVTHADQQHKAKLQARWPRQP